VVAIRCANQSLESWVEDGEYIRWEAAGGGIVERLGASAAEAAGMTRPLREVPDVPSISSLGKWESNELIVGGGECSRLRIPDGRVLEWMDRGNSSGFQYHAQQVARWDNLALRLSDGRTGLYLQGHTDVVLGATVLNDGSILSWSRDRTLRVWDTGSGKTTAILEGHGSEVLGAIEIQAGRVLSWSADGTLRMWKLHGNANPVAPEKHSCAVQRCVVTTSDRLVTWTGKLGDAVYVWDVKAGRCTARITHSSEIDGFREVPPSRIVTWSRAGENVYAPAYPDITQGSVAAEFKECDTLRGIIRSLTFEETKKLVPDLHGEGGEPISSASGIVYTPQTIYQAEISGAPLDEGPRWSNGWEITSADNIVRVCPPGSVTPVYWFTELPARICNVWEDGTLALALSNGEVAFVRLYTGSQRRGF